MPKLTDFNEWVSILDHNIGTKKIPDFILFLVETCCDDEQKLKLIKEIGKLQKHCIEENKNEN